MPHPLAVPLDDPDSVPASWYTVGAARDLPAGGLMQATVAGIDLVIYRIDDGTVHCVTDRCPHLGGRFSAGGTVRGDELICPVHRFRYAPDGHCVESGYGTPAPKACTRVWPCLERNGLLLVYYHPRAAAPDWEPPALTDADDWLAMTLFKREVAASAEVIMQGIADAGHLRTVHGYEDVQMDTRLAAEGAHLAVTFSFTNVGSLPGLSGPFARLGRLLETRTRVEFDYLACGMGYSVTDVRIPELGVAMRHFVNPTPIDAGSVVLYHTMALKRIEEPGRISPVLGWLPRAFTQTLMYYVLRKGFLHDIEDDIHLWTNMRNLESPALARGDGPLHKYYKWSRQFYAEAA